MNNMTDMAEQLDIKLLLETLMALVENRVVAD